MSHSQNSVSKSSVAGRSGVSSASRRARGAISHLVGLAHSVGDKEDSAPGKEPQVRPQADKKPSLVPVWKSSGSELKGTVLKDSDGPSPGGSPGQERAGRPESLICKATGVEGHLQVWASLGDTGQR